MICPHEQQCEDHGCANACNHYPAEDLTRNFVDPYGRSWDRQDGKPMTPVQIDAWKKLIAVHGCDRITVVTNSSGERLLRLDT